VAAALAATGGFRTNLLEGDPRVAAAVALVLALSMVLARLLRRVGVLETTTFLLVGAALGPATAPFWPTLLRPGPLSDGYLSPALLEVLRPLAAGSLWLACFGGAEEAGRGTAGKDSIAAVGALTSVQLLSAGAVLVAVGLGLPRAPAALLLPHLSDPWTIAVLVAAPLVAGSPALSGAQVQTLRAEGVPSRLVTRTAVFGLLLFTGMSPFLAVDQRRPLAAFPIALVAGVALGFAAGPIVGRLRRGRVALVTAGLLAAGFGAEALRVPALPMLAVAGYVSTVAARGGAVVATAFSQVSFPVRAAAFTLLGAALLGDGTDLAPAALLATTLTVARVGLAAGLMPLAARLGGLDEGFRRFGFAAVLQRAELVVPLGLGLVATPDPQAALAGRVILLMAGLDALLGPEGLRWLFRETDDSPEHVAEQQAAARLGDPDDPEPFGPNPELSDPRLSSELRDLRFDLERLAGEVSLQLFEPLRQEAESYVRDLRREFLRHHRRVTVQARTAEEGEEVAGELRVQQSELADRFRAIVLRRTAALSRPGRFRPAHFFEAVDKVVAATAEALIVPVEPATYEPRPGDPLWKRLDRFVLRRRRGVARVLGLDPPRRRLPLRRLVRHHLYQVAVPGLEGTLSLVLEQQAELVARTRSLFDAVVQGYDAFAAQAVSGDGDPRAGLEALRTDTEEELAFCLSEAVRIEQEGGRRVHRTLGTGFRRVADESARLGTLDLPARERADPRPVRRQRRLGWGLLARFEGAERGVSAGFGLLALELELVGLEARLKDALAGELDELAADVRGRSAIQADRVAGALQEAAGSLGELAPTEPGGNVAGELRTAAEGVEKVVREASRGGTQLRDQLLDEGTISPFLDAFRRAAGGVTERYEIPASPLLRAEWQVPPPPGVAEVPFRDLVTAHIETVVAPRLVEIVRDFANRVEPLLGSLAELERRLAFNVELLTADLDVQPDEPMDDATRDLLDEMVATTLEKTSELLRGHANDAEGWPEELRQRLSEAVLGGVRELRRQLLDGEVSDLRIQLLRQSAGRRLVRGAEALPSNVARVRRETVRAFRRVVGEDRLDAGWRVLGLRSGFEAAPIDPAAFAPPRSPTDRVPLVYRRLFSPESLEAGDVLTGREEEIGRGVAALETRVGGADGRGATVVLIGQDGVGKGAVASAIVRGTRFKQVRRHRFAKPVLDLDELDEMFPSGSGQLVVARGLHWLAAPSPGGLEPLRRFVERLVTDAGRNAFLLQADALVWSHLVGLSGVGDVATDVIRLGPLDREPLRAAVLARHRLSGLGLSFGPSTEDRGLEERLLRAAGRLRRPYDSYFRRLHVASGGLVRDALRLWLASIERVDDKADVVHVGPLPDSPLPAIRALPEETLLTLHAVARSGWMDATGYAHLFRTEQVRAEARLARLERWGLLKSENGIYRVTVHLRGALHRALRDRGWVEDGE